MQFGKLRCNTFATCNVKIAKRDSCKRLSSKERREKLLKEMFAEIGEGCYIEPPLRANWGGRHVHFGKNVYVNFNLTLVDDTHIYVGDYTMIGPNVTVATAGHPILPELREKGYQYNIPVTIGKNCWIGAGAILVPGVTIGDNSVIGAGSVDSCECSCCWKSLQGSQRNQCA